MAAPLFFEGFRTALGSTADGLIRPGQPATDAELAAAARALGRPALPDDYATFLRSFDGADLFHEALVLCGVGGGCFRTLVDANLPAPPLLAEGELVIAEAINGDRYARQAPASPPGSTPSWPANRSSTTPRASSGWRPSIPTARS
jgi:hypothetical protein